MVMVMAEWTAAEIMLIFATYLSVTAVGAMSVCYNYYSLLWYVNYGFQSTMTALVGNYIGMED